MKQLIFSLIPGIKGVPIPGIFPIFNRKLFIIIFSFLILNSKFLIPNSSVLAAGCSDVAPGGDLTISTNCTFAGNVNGVDSGTGATNTALLSMSNTGTLTVGATQQVAMGSLSIQTGGSIVIFTGGSLNFGTPIWMTDADADGLPSSTTQIISSTPPANGRRRNIITSLTTPDASDTEYCPANFNPAGVCNQCSNGGIVNIADGQDVFAECGGGYNSCNGNGACSLHAKKVFVSSVAYNGNLGNLSGADSKCQTLANNALLGGAWKAWLSNTTTSAASRFTQSAVPYILVNNTTKIADNWTTLTDGAIDAPINIRENGQTVASNFRVWTNTAFNGSIFTTTANNVCTNWTSASPSRNGRAGNASLYLNDDWTNEKNQDCDDSRRLYCFEQ